MTQSLALKRLLEDAGHEVVAVFMGEDPRRPIPSFVREKLRRLLQTYAAPNFEVDKKAKGIRPWRSLLQTFPRLPQFMDAAPRVHATIRETRPHLLVNFYDLLGGLYPSLYRPGIPIVSVAHQFLFFPPAFPVVTDKWWEVKGVKWNTFLTAIGADLRLALSFSPLPDLPRWRTKVVPPLLREAVLEADPSPGSHVLAYVLNPGYAEELDRWQGRNPQVDLHCFWDRRDVPEEVSPRQGLTFHRLSEEKFLELLVTCRAYTSTAGFESVSEAAYLGKPVMVVPTLNHVEQRCNALDAERARVAVWREEFDLSEFIANLGTSPASALEDFRRWVQGAGETILPLLEGAAMGENPFV